MKKSLLLLAAAMICGMLFTGCNKDHDDGPEWPDYDTSLAESVSHIFSIREAEGSYGGVFFENPQPAYSELSIKKVSDSEISIFCILKWEEMLLTASIPVIPLSGESYNVIFDHTTSDATIKYNQAKYTQVNASVKGWIKNIAFLKTRTSLIWPEIRCGITIGCEIDGKKLILNISKTDYI